MFDIMFDTMIHFGYLKKSFGNIRKRSFDPETTFGESSEIIETWRKSENR